MTPRRQRPKGAWKRPRRGETVTVRTTTQPLPARPRAQDYSEEKHAVTTNQEPSVSWPSVDLPELSGHTVEDAPIDNAQDDPSTIYDPAQTDTVPYMDYDEGPPDGG